MPTIPSDGHVVNDSGHTTDHNNLIDVVGNLVAIGQQLYQQVPSLPVNNTNNQNNLNALVTQVGGTVTALLNTQLAAPNGVASLDSNTLVPVSELPVSATSLVLSGAGTPSTATGLNGDTYINQSTNQEYVKSAGLWGQNSAVFWGQLATNGPTGSTLSTVSSPTFLQWTAPNDGAMHRVQVITQIVGNSPSGGTIAVTFADPGGTGRSASQFGALTNGYNNQVSPLKTYLVAPNQPVTLGQAGALISGAGTIYAEFWGS